MEDRADTDSPVLRRSAIADRIVIGPRKKCATKKEGERGVIHLEGPVMDNEYARMHGRFSHFTPVARLLTGD